MRVIFRNESRRVGKKCFVARVLENRLIKRSYRSFLAYKTLSHDNKVPVTL